MTSINADLLAAMRKWASDPSGICFVVQGRAGSGAIFRDDIEGRDDESLLAFIRMRCSGDAPEGWTHRSIHVIK